MEWKREEAIHAKETAGNAREKARIERWGHMMIERNETLRSTFLGRI